MVFIVTARTKRANSNPVLLKPVDVIRKLKVRRNIFLLAQILDFLAQRQILLLEFERGLAEFHNLLLCFERGAFFQQVGDLRIGGKWNHRWRKA